MKEKQSFWKNLKSTVASLIILALLLSGVGGCHYVNWLAYKQRYPEASYWTYWFRSNK